MTNLTQVEVNFIRESVACHQTTSAKLSNYANQVQDTQIKKMFETAADEARKSAQTLISLL